MEVNKITTHTTYNHNNTYDDDINNNSDDDDDDDDEYRDNRAAPPRTPLNQWVGKVVKGAELNSPPPWLCESFPNNIIGLVQLPIEHSIIWRWGKLNNFIEDKDVKSTCTNVP